MDLEGARRIDAKDLKVSPGEEIVSTNPFRPAPSSILRLIENDRVPVPAWASTMSREACSGFYSDRWGPAPYVFGTPPDQLYRVLAFQTGKQ
jgi:hypothetical protein